MTVWTRPALESDSAQIAALSAELGYPSSQADVLDRIRNLAQSHSDLVLVAALESGSLAGWIQAHSACTVEAGFRVEILGLVVAAMARRAGIGRKLVVAAEAWARGKGSPVMVVRSNIARTESHVFYPALGYEVSKTQRVYRKILG
jgi:predicted N-acetyltransferase YhbS